MSRPLVCCVVLLISLLSAPAFAQSVIGVSGAFYVEDGELTGEQQASVQTTDESFTYVSDGFLQASLYYLTHLDPAFRIGGGLTYYGTYTAEIPGDEGDEPEYFEFGRLVEMMARMEYLINVTPTIDIMLGGHVGLPILFTDGDLQREIDELQDQQASVWDLPRIGYVVGPQLSARYKYLDHLHFRFDAGLKWEQLFLFNTTEEVQGIPFRKDWATSTLRTEVGFAIEVDLTRE